jgi:hypothetical protein
MFSQIGDDYPLHPSECACKPKNVTVFQELGSASLFTPLNSTNPEVFPCEVSPASTKTSMFLFQILKPLFSPIAQNNGGF